MPRIAVFLGAGASAAEGSPVQNKLFHEYFASREDTPSETSNRIRQGLTDFSCTHSTWMWREHSEASASFRRLRRHWV